MPVLPDKRVQGPPNDGDIEVYDRPTNQWILTNYTNVQGPQGPAGPPGPTGPQGPQGPVGPGVAAGGTQGQVLIKNSGTNYDTFFGVYPIVPNPVTSGSTIQVFTDVIGDVWVAKNGVNGGNWKRARDVLFAKAYRNAAYTYPTAQTAFPCDTVTNDDYGLITGLNTTSFAFVAPVAGIYTVTNIHRTTASTAGLYVTAGWAGETLGLQVTATGSGSWTGSTLTMNIKVAASANIQPLAYASSAVAMAGGAQNNCVTVMYTGTG